jgi:hypothetical protein
MGTGSRIVEPGSLEEVVETVSDVVEELVASGRKPEAAALNSALGRFSQNEDWDPWASLVELVDGYVNSWINGLASEALDRAMTSLVEWEDNYDAGAFERAQQEDWEAEARNPS